MFLGSKLDAKKITALIQKFTPSLTGAVPAPGTASGAKFLRDDGTWTAANVSYFGTGAPVTLHNEGDLYFDTSTGPYTQYVQHSGAWHAA